MGKYMKKSKMTGDVAVMEVSVSPSSTLGVRTRAKTLALQRLNSSSGAPNPDDTSSCYLQLRSRRLEKPPLVTETKKQQQQTHKEKTCRGEKPSPSRSPSPSTSSSSSPVGYVCERKEKEKDEGCFGKKGKMEGAVFKGISETEDVGFEASFGENNLDFEARDRSTRESTPCSLIRDSDTIGTPGSTTRRRSSTATYQRVHNDVQRNIPTTLEMEEFFACVEQQQQRLFIEKYNFDIVNDLPLPGRYEWVQVMP